MRESKFGPALVVETTAQSGGYVLGFKVDPKVRGGGCVCVCVCVRACAQARHCAAPGRRGGTEGEEERKELIP